MSANLSISEFRPSTSLLTSDEEKRILPSFLPSPPTDSRSATTAIGIEGGRGWLGKEGRSPRPVVEKGGGGGGAGGGGGRGKRRRRNFAWTQKAPFSSSQRSLVASHCRKGGGFLLRSGLRWKIINCLCMKQNQYLYHTVLKTLSIHDCLMQPRLNASA